MTERAWPSTQLLAEEALERIGEGRRRPIAERARDEMRAEAFRRRDWATLERMADEMRRERV